MTIAMRERFRPGRRRAAMVVLLVGLATLPGCKLFGALAVNLGLVPSKKVEALYAFGPGPILILVDDDAELVTWSQAATHLSERIQHYVGKARRAQGKKIENSFVRARNVAALRRDDPGFDKRSIPEIAEILSAKEVLWIQVMQFFVSSEVEGSQTINGTPAKNYRHPSQRLASLRIKPLCLIPDGQVGILRGLLRRTQPCMQSLLTAVNA